MTTDQIKQQLQDLYVEHEASKSAQDRDYRQAVLPFVQDILNPTIKVETSYSYQLSVYIKPVDTTITWSNLCEFYYRMGYRGNPEQETFHGLELSYYTTGADTGSDRGRYELNRLPIIGKVAELLLTREAEMLATAQAVYDKYKDSNKEYYSKLGDLKRELTQAEDLERENEYENFLLTASKEIIFRKLVYFDMANESSYRRDLWGIDSFQIMETSTSGKTFTIRFGWKTRNVDGTEGPLRYMTEKVKADKLKRIYYRDLKEHFTI